MTRRGIVAVGVAALTQAGEDANGSMMKTTGGSDTAEDSAALRKEFDPLDADIGLRVRLIRKARGVSQAALGQALGCSFQQVQKYERGVNRMSGSTLVRAARFLETDPNELCGFKAKSDGPEDPLRPKGRDGVEALRLFNAVQSARSRRAVLHLLRGVVADENGDAESYG